MGQWRCVPRSLGVASTRGDACAGRGTSARLHLPKERWRRRHPPVPCMASTRGEAGAGSTGVLRCFLMEGRYPPPLPGAAATSWGEDGAHVPWGPGRGSLLLIPSSTSSSSASFFNPSIDFPAASFFPHRLGVFFYEGRGCTRAGTPSTVRGPDNAIVRGCERKTGDAQPLSPVLFINTKCINLHICNKYFSILFSFLYFIFVL